MKKRLSFLYKFSAIVILLALASLWVSRHYAMSGLALSFLTFFLAVLISAHSLRQRCFPALVLSLMGLGISISSVAKSTLIAPPPATAPAVSQTASTDTGE